MVEFKDDGTATTLASRGRTVTPSPQSWPIWWPSNWTKPA